MRVVLKNVESPQIEYISPQILSDETMEIRKEKVIKTFVQEGYDCIIIYADVEHSANFEYLTGFIPRFEEACLVLHKNGDCYLLLGNEVLGMSKHSRIKNTPLHVPHFSLPDQPLEGKKEMVDYFKEAKITNKKVGLIGWKALYKINKDMLDVPHYIVEAIKTITLSVSNATNIMIGEVGVRRINTVDEIRHYEYGQVLAASNMLKALDSLQVGKTEIEMASILESEGQRNNVVTIFSTGKRFAKANLYPSMKKMILGDAISMTVGYKGGLSSRTGYLVSDKNQLSETESDYIEKVAAPYFNAVRTWLENIHVGMSGKELYAIINRCLPKKIYRWSLNPGHLAADEEWLCSPIYKDSNESLESGMILQIDIIPSVEGYSKPCCENGILLANEQLRERIKNQDYEMWRRFETRRQYIKEQLGIELHEDVCPLSNMVAYYRPFLLDKRKALSIID